MSRQWFCVVSRSGLYLTSIGSWSVDWDIARRFRSEEEADAASETYGGRSQRWQRGRGNPACGPDRS